MRPLIHVTDPVFEQKNYSSLDRFFLKYIKDERDLPFAYLILKIMFTVIPAAIILFFVEGVVWWGIAGLFLEAHPDPDNAKCDGPCALRLDRLEPFLAQMQTLDNTIKALPAFENN